MENRGPYSDRNVDQYVTEGPGMTNHWPAHHYTEGNEAGQVGNATRSQYRGQMPRQDFGLEKGMEQDMDIGYEDKPSPLTLEALEKKFFDEKMKLAKEESEAESAENARHMESKIEIRNQFQEKLSALRALQSKRRDEFLYKETQEQWYQYHQQQQPVPNNYPTNTTALDPRGYGPNHYLTDSTSLDSHGYGPNHYPTDTTSSDPRGYDPNYYQTDTSPADSPSYGRPVTTKHDGYAPVESYREGSPYSQVQRNQLAAEGRVPVPQGRSYNNMRARNF